MLLLLQIQRISEEVKETVRPRREKTGKLKDQRADGVWKFVSVWQQHDFITGVCAALCQLKVRVPGYPCERQV